MISLIISFILGFALGWKFERMYKQFQDTKELREGLTKTLKTKLGVD